MKPTRIDYLVVTAALLAGTLILASAGRAQQPLPVESSIPWGTPGVAQNTARANSAEAQTPTSRNLGRITPTTIYHNASASVGGVGLRNRGGGGIEISGSIEEIKAAFVYWAVITEGPPTAAASQIELRRDLPRPSTGYQTIAGTVVGRGLSPCWLGDRITVFRGTVPRATVIGNGQYSVRLAPGANALTNGADPWTASPPPMFEGVSLVLIRHGTGTVALYQRGLAGQTFSINLDYELVLPSRVAAASEVVMHSIGADGQSGVSTLPTKTTAAEVVRLGRHGPLLAGPGSRTNDGHWNGVSAGPLPQLWDTTSLDITREVRQVGINIVLPINVSAPFDCLTPVAHLIEIR